MRIGGIWMKDVFLVYDKSCFYEIVILNYFMSFSNCDMVFCSLDGKPVRAMEGFSVNVDLPLEVLDNDGSVTLGIMFMVLSLIYRYGAELHEEKE